jgi:hypothetical protein
MVFGTMCEIMNFDTILISEDVIEGCIFVLTSFTFVNRNYLYTLSSENSVSASASSTESV